MSTVSHDFHITSGRRSKKTINAGEAPPPLPPGQLPRITKLMALAIRLDGMISSGEVTNQTELARLAHITRARMTQIMNLCLLAPDLQERLLFLPAKTEGRDPILLRDMQPLAAIPDWQQQRKYFAANFGDAKLANGVMAFASSRRKRTR